MLKITRIVLCILLPILMISCGSDDECTTASIEGTYAGPVLCTNGIESVTEEITLIVQNTGGNTYEAVDSDGTPTVFTVDGCDITIPEVETNLFGLNIKVSGDGNIDGNQFNLNIDTEIDGESATCDYSLLKQ